MKPEVWVDFGNLTQLIGPATEVLTQILTSFYCSKVVFVPNSMGLIQNFLIETNGSLPENH